MLRFTRMTCIPPNKDGDSVTNGAFWWCRIYRVYRAAKLRSLNFLSLFRGLHKPTRFGGGGVVAEFFRDPQKPTRFSGGGGSSRIFQG